MAEQTRTDRANVVRLVAILAVLIVVIALVLDNTKKVKIGYVFGDAETPLFFLILLTLALGVVLDRLWIWFRHRD